MTDDSSIFTDAAPTQCCAKTIDKHSAYNKMVVCTECNRCIKIYEDEQSFKNYQNYCLSRGRKVSSAKYGNFFVVFQDAKMFN
jgi:hypothetical protein